MSTWDKDLVKSCMVDAQKLLDRIVMIKPINPDEHRAFVSALEAICVLLPRLGALIDIADFTEGK